MEQLKFPSDLVDKNGQRIYEDDEMKPAKGVKVFVRTKSNSYYFATYDDGWYVDHKPVGDDIVAWMLIPECNPTL